MTAPTWIDYAVIAWVLAVTLWLGYAYRSRAGRDTQGFFLSGRSLPWWALGVSMVATTFAADTPLAVSGLVADRGIAGNWVWWCFAFGTTLSVQLFASRWRRSELTTDVELVALRYGGFAGGLLRGFRALYMSLLFTSLVLGWVLKAMGTVLTVAFGLDPAIGHWIVCGLAALALVYTLSSGLIGVIATDLVQFVVAMAGSIALACLAWDEAGGLDGLRARLDTTFGAERAGSMLSFLPDTANELAGFGLVLLAFYLCAQWWAVVYPGNEPGGGSYVAQRMLAARSERDARAGTLLFAVAHYALRPWPWIVVGLWAAAAYGLSGAEAEQGYVRAMLELLPPGLFGLLVASFFAAFMSTVDTQLNLAASYLVNDFYRPFLRRKASDAHYVRAARVAIVLVLGVAVYVATELSGVAQAWKLLIALGAGSGGVLIARWFWWRVNAYAEVAAMCASFTVALLVDPGLRTITHLGEGWLEGFLIPGEGPRLFVIVAASTVVWVAVTLCTPAASEARLDAFYARVRPVGFWGPVARRAVHVRPDQSLAQDLCGWVLSIVLVFGLLFGTGKWLFGDPLAAAALGGAALLAGILLWGNSRI